MSSSNNNLMTKDPFLLRLEEQERKFATKRSHKAELNEDDEYNEFDLPSDDLSHQSKHPKFHHITEMTGPEMTAPLVTVTPSSMPTFERVEAPAHIQVQPASVVSGKKQNYELPSIFAPPPRNDQIPSDRSARNIAYLCAKIAEELRKRPQTRDELSVSTGFARQRICTVISVFRAIGLVKVKDSNTRRSEVQWSEDQAKILPNISDYVVRALDLRKENKELKAKEQELIKQLKEKQAAKMNSVASSGISNSDYRDNAFDLSVHDSFEGANRI